MYTKYELDNYNIYLVKMKKFKTITISINFRRENARGDCVYSALLKNMLLLATAKYHDLDELSKAKMDIYAPHISITTYLSGKERNICIEGTFADEKYTETSMNEKSIKFIMDYFWDPYVENNSFNKETFNICKYRYIEQLKNTKDNPDDYIKTKLDEKMDIMPFDVETINDCIQMAEKITAKDLYKYYKSIFNEDALDIFVAGDFADEKMLDIIKPLVKGNFKQSYKNRIIERCKQNKEIKEFIEQLPNEQSKLAIGLKQYGLNEFERKYSSLAYFNILGGGWNSKLNKSVRGKNSMCYYIYTSRIMTFNVGFIHSGISSENYEKVLNLIKQEMKNIKDGKITEEELNIVKETYINALTNIEDSQVETLDSIISEIFSDTDPIKERIKNIKKVTIQDVKNVASKIEIDTIYLLKGECK